VLTQAEVTLRSSGSRTGTGTQDLQQRGRRRSHEENGEQHVARIAQDVLPLQNHQDNQNQEAAIQDQRERSEQIIGHLVSQWRRDVANLWA
jgi:hypothetical protein